MTQPQPIPEDDDVDVVARATEMAMLSASERNRRIIYGVLLGKVIDARELFRPTDCFYD